MMASHQPPPRMEKEQQQRQQQQQQQQQDQQRVLNVFSTTLTSLRLFSLVAAVTVIISLPSTSASFLVKTFRRHHHGHRQVTTTSSSSCPSFLRVTNKLHMSSSSSSSSSFPSSSTERMDGWYPGQYLINVDEERIAFDELYVGKSNELVMYLPNLAEGRRNPTTDEIQQLCIKRERNFISADWFGRGGSSGKLMNATISRWVDDVITILDNVPTHITSRVSNFRKAVLVGKAVGVWVAVLVALQRPDLVRGIVGIGADPDFTEDLLWEQLPDEEKEAIMMDGFREIQWGSKNEVYPITSSLIEDGRKNLVLRGGPNSLPIDCPVRLIHNLSDEEVPPMTSIRLAECIDSQDIVLNMPKFGTLGYTNAIDECFAATPDKYDPRYDVA